MATKTKTKGKKSKTEEEPKKKSKGGNKLVYCMKCKEKVEPEKAKVVQTSNGRNMMKGKCPDCGTTVVKFVS